MQKLNRDVPALLKNLKKNYPEVECALDHATPLQLAVATILSAQCTDERVNKVTPALFKRCPTAESFSKISPLELEKLIHSTGFYRNKAKSIRGMAELVMKKHGGEIPKTMADLLELPGVARKTANVVLGTAFGIAEGVVVDTHVMRLSQRLGLTKQTAPEKIEKDLMEKVPREDWIWFSHAVITHGRKICKARGPLCFQCPIRKNCANPVFPEA